MAEAFIQVLLDNLTSFLKGELALLFGLQNEFERLSSMLSTIQAVLEDAQEKRLKDKALENWLQKLNTAAYKVDDILDEYKTKATRFLHFKYSSCHPTVIWFSHNIGIKMDEVMQKLEAIAAERRNFHLQEKIIERQANKRETGFFLTAPQVHGRDKEVDEIVNTLTIDFSDAQQLSVLPILGIGGIGKTTLAQMVFKDQRVIDHFDHKIWICVSEDFNEKKLIKAIVEFIEEKTFGDDMGMALLQKKLQHLLNGKKYFLVLDDVWNEDQAKWANLQAVLNVGASGASVLATTRLEKVGSIMGTLRPYELSNLSQEDCWSLFRQCVVGLQKEINPKLVSIGKEIVKKCGGVPLAAQTLGRILHFKREEIEWEHVRDSEIWNLPQDETSILPALRISYHHLPLDLRQCFAYCAVFPKDTEMEKENLITLWMAHGFLLSKGNLEPEDVGNEVWNELYLRSFFQEIEVEYGKTYFKMHDLIHDLASSLFLASTSSSNIREINVEAYSYRKCIGFAEVVSSYSPPIFEKFVSLRVLNLSHSVLEQLPSSIGDLVHLRYLDLSYNGISSLPEQLCQLQNLQTLHLQHCSSLSCLPSSIGDLVHLRYLDLSYNGISSLPEQLCQLQNLQTLDLQRCRSLSCLPEQTSKLVSLRNLLLDNGLTCMPPMIGSLTCLKTLSHFVVGETEGYQLRELRNLNLCGSISIENLERVKDDRDAKEANLSVKGNLHSLSMSWDDDDDEPHRYESEEDKVLEALKPHPNLKSLKIRGFRGLRFPDWMNHSVLKNVVIKDCINCSCLPPFGELPCLEGLELWNGSAEMEYVEEGVDVHSGRRRFPSMRKLTIGCFPNLKGLLKKEGEEQFPVLEEMEISNCPRFVFPTLSSVKKLEIWRGKADATGFKSISNLSALTSLHISINEATSLPEEMFKSLANLKYLEISTCCNLKELPSSLASLNALTHMKIYSCNALESLPEEGVKGLTSLKELSIGDCEMLKCLPEGLQHLTALTTLTVWDCPQVGKRCEKGIGEDWHKIAHIPKGIIYS